MNIDAIVPRGSAYRTMLRDLSGKVFDRAPSNLRQNFTSLDGERIARLEDFIKANYFHPASYWNTNEGLTDLHNLSRGRTELFRTTYAPWFSKHIQLRDARILEIGCGMGASSLVFAEQGAHVTGIDIEHSATRIAAERFKIFGLDGQFHTMNATDVSASLDLGSFDLVVFFAVLEHMTRHECIESLRSVLGGLRPGSLFAVIDTPNRLWYYDVHTARENFFHWLPSDVASQYTRFLERPLINEIHSEADPELSLQRWGRGVSYHEFELAAGERRLPTIVSDYHPFSRRRNPLRAAKWALSKDRAYHRILRSVAPATPPAFLQPYLDFLGRV